MTGTTVGKIGLREDLDRGLLSSSSLFLAARPSNSFFLAASRKNKNFWRNSTVSGSSSRFLLASSVLSRIIQCRGTCTFFGMIPGMSDSHLFRQSWNNAGPGPLDVRVSWIRSMKKNCSSTEHSVYVRRRACLCSLGIRSRSCLWAISVPCSRVRRRVKIFRKKKIGVFTLYDSWMNVLDNTQQDDSKRFDFC